jgi:hypothetical protein
MFDGMLSRSEGSPPRRSRARCRGSSSRCLSVWRRWRSSPRCCTPTPLPPRSNASSRRASAPRPAADEAAPGAAIASSRADGREPAEKRGREPLGSLRYPGEIDYGQAETAGFFVRNIPSIGQRILAEAPGVGSVRDIIDRLTARGVIGSRNPINKFAAGYGMARWSDKNSPHHGLPFVSRRGQSPTI